MAPQTESERSTLRSVLLADRWRILFLVAVTAFVIYLIGISFAVPRWTQLFGMTFVIAAVFIFPYVRWFVDWLYQPDFVYLLKYDAQSGETALWELPQTVWRDLETTEYELHSLNAKAPAWQTTQYDPETNTAKGHWLGSATDLELVESRAAVHEVKTELEDMAQEGLIVRVRQSSAVRSAVHKIVSAFLADYEGATGYGDEQLQDMIDEAVEDWSLSKSSPGSIEDDDDESQDVESIDSTDNEITTKNYD